MGFLRLYLALCVVEAHAGNFLPWAAPRGMHAVQLFFVISGFYMAMVLSLRYRSTVTFYRSRWLRIAVPYYWHLLAIAVLSLAGGLCFSQWLSRAAWADEPSTRNGSAGLAFAVVANVAIFGQDALLFFHDNTDSGLRFTGAFGDYPDPLYRYLVMPQCWTVALELVFYLMAPFLNRLRTISLVGILGVSLFARFAAYQFAGLGHDPWTYRFIPFELALFVAGMLAWRLLSFWKKGFPRATMLSPLAYLALCAAIVFCGFLFRTGYEESWRHFDKSYVGFVFCLSCTPLIALIFLATSTHSFDRLLGELSYPIYLNHLFFIVAMRALGEGNALSVWSGVLAAVLSVLSALIFWQMVLRRLEDKRHRLFGLASL